MAALFGSILTWPIAATAILSQMYTNSDAISKIAGLDIFTTIGTTQVEIIAAMVIIWFGIIISFFISGYICVSTWDDWINFKKAISRLKMSKVTRQNLRGYLLTISNNLAD
jgi:type III secretory pathway component EscU